jgi:hypothetical protein
MEEQEETFIELCQSGCLDEAKELLQLYPNISEYYKERAFHKVCCYGQLEVAKWLLSVKQDIDISCFWHFAFCNACEEGLLEVAQWLQSLKPYLYVIEYDINGKYIGYKVREHEEENWEKRKYALHLALQEKTNILYHLPTDIAKAVTLFV